MFRLSQAKTSEKEVRVVYLQLNLHQARLLGLC